MDSVFNLNGLGIDNLAYSKCEALRMIGCFEESKAFQCWVEMYSFSRMIFQVSLMTIGIVISILKNRIRNTLSGVVEKLMNM